MASNHRKPEIHIAWTTTTYRSAALLVLAFAAVAFISNGERRRSADGDSDGQGHDFTPPLPPEEAVIRVTAQAGVNRQQNKIVIP